MDTPRIFSDETWQKCLEEYLEAVQARSGSAASASAYTSILRRFFSNPDKLPPAYTRADVRAFVARPAASGKPVAPDTQNHRASAISSFLKWASQYEVTTPDRGLAPLYQQTLITQGLRYLAPGRPYRCMGLEELRAFFNCIDRTTITGSRNFALFSCMFWTCRRKSEIIRLVWKDIAEAVIRDADGGSHSGYTYRYVSKGHSRESRIAELPLPCARAIFAYLEKAGRLATIKPDEPIFTPVKRSGRADRDGAKIEPLNGDYCNLVFKAICVKANLEVSRLSLHSLRHAGARARLESGSTVQEISSVLGHADVGITWRYLAYLSPIADGAVKRLESSHDFLSH